MFPRSGPTVVIDDPALGKGTSIEPVRLGLFYSTRWVGAFLLSAIEFADGNIDMNEEAVNRVTEPALISRGGLFFVGLLMLVCNPSCRCHRVGSAGELSIELLW